MPSCRYPHFSFEAERGLLRGNKRDPPKNSKKGQYYPQVTRKLKMQRHIAPVQVCE